MFRTINIDISELTRASDLRRLSTTNKPAAVAATTTGASNTKDTMYVA